MVSELFQDCFVAVCRISETWLVALRTVKAADLQAIRIDDGVRRALNERRSENAPCSSETLAL
jgi:hypothetical protein